MKVLHISVICVLCFICELCYCTFLIVVNVHKPEACFRRVLAGNRVSSRFVKRFLICERIEDCQLECGEEKHFVCEGFNYRLDPTGRGKGECELLDVPLQRLDIGRDVYPDREYDYYERDRNIARTQCQERPRYPDYGVKRPTYDHHGYDRRPGYNYYPTRRYDVGPYKYDRRPSYYDKVDYHDNRPTYDYDRRRPYGKRRPSYSIDNKWHGSKDFQKNEVPDVICVHYDKK